MSQLAKLTLLFGLFYCLKNVIISETALFRFIIFELSSPHPPNPTPLSPPVKRFRRLVKNYKCNFIKIVPNIFVFVFLR